MRKWVVALVAIAGAIPQAGAQSGGYSLNVIAKCKPEAERLCPQHELGSSEMRYCMEAKGRQLSRDCTQALEDDGIIPRGTVRNAGRTK